MIPTLLFTTPNWTGTKTNSIVKQSMDSLIEVTTIIVSSPIYFRYRNQIIVFDFE